MQSLVRAPRPLQTLARQPDVNDLLRRLISVRFPSELALHCVEDAC